MARTVLVVDDHPQFREAARRLLEVSGFLVVGEAADAQAALKAVDLLEPEIVLLDIQLPGIDGFAVANEIARRGSMAKVILTSSRDPATFRRRIAVSPAQGFIAKDQLTGDGIEAMAGRR